MKRLLALALIFVALVWLLPAYLTVQASFMSTFTSPQHALGHVHLENWRALPWRSLARWAFNSLVVCGMAALLCPLISVSAGYAFVRYNFPGKEWLFYAFLLAIVMPGILLFLPRYLLFSKAGMRNSYVGLFLPAVLSPALVFFSRQYLARINLDIIEAARLDGASELRILYSIIRPLSTPLIILGMIMGFTTAHANFIWQYLIAPNRTTLTTGIGLFLLAVSGSEEFMLQDLTLGRPISWESLRATVSVLLSLPPLILYILGQKHFLKGLRI